MQQSRKSYRTVVSLAVAAVVLVTGISENQAIAQSAETLRHFDEGNNYFSEGAFQKAIESYEAALSSGYDGSAIRHNLANTYYRLDELGLAILNYKRGLRFEPDNKELLHGLALANGRIRDQFSTLPEPALSKIWKRLIAITGEATAVYIGLLAYLIAMGLLGMRLWTGRNEPWIRRSTAALLIIGLPLLLGGLLTSRAASAVPEAVVLADEATIFEEPSEEATVSVVVHEGLSVDVLDTDSLWSQIRLPNGVTGWTNSETLANL